MERLTAGLTRATLFSRAKIGDEVVEKKDIWSLQQQADARKLLADIDNAVATMETSFSITRAVRALMKRYKERWPE